MSYPVWATVYESKAYDELRSFAPVFVGWKYDAYGNTMKEIESFFRADEMTAWYTSSVTPGPTTVFVGKFFNSFPFDDFDYRATKESVKHFDSLCNMDTDELIETLNKTGSEFAKAAENIKSTSISENAKKDIIFKYVLMSAGMDPAEL